MSVLTVRPEYGALSGNASLEGVREYVKCFLVTTSTPDDGVMTVGNDSRLPKKGDTWSWKNESDAGALCYEVHPVQDPNCETVWTVTCSYSSNIGGEPGGFVRGDPARDVDNPLNRPVDVTVSHWVENEIITHDIHGDPILTPLGREYSPPLQRRRKRRMLIIARNEAAYPAALAESYEQCVNTDLFYDGAPGTVKLEDVSATAHFDQGVFYWRCRYEFRYRKEGWKAEVLRLSPTYLVQTSLNTWEEKQAKDSDGIYHDNMVLVSDTGELLTQAQITQMRAVPKGQPGGLFDLWEVCEPKPFSALNL